MSAIWGIVDFQKETVNENLAERMRKPFDTYKIDRYQHYVSNKAMFGYGGQYFTKEARNEVQPIIDDTESIYFIADVILDNRAELFELLNIKKEDWNGIPDGSLMYQIYKKYGKKSYHLFLGTYAFASYDKNKGEVVLITDAVGSRSLYYSFVNGKLYFSTLIKPILEAWDCKKDWNYRYLSHYLALNNLAHDTEIEETPYQNIYKVSPGQAVTISRQSIVKEEYWKVPLKTKCFKKSNEDFKKEFIDLFDKCVESVMRSPVKTGILLSGGLDSTSVACMAAPKLRAKGEILYSYTSVPEKGYISKEVPYFNTNEQNMVEITKDYLGNMLCSYLELPGMNAFDGAEELLQKYELPYKSLQNYRWLHECAMKSAEDGCRIVLTGQFGNATISFGDYMLHFNSLLKSGHLIELYKEINAFHSKEQARRKKVYKSLFRNFFSGLIKSNSKESAISYGFANPALIRNYCTNKQFSYDNTRNSSMNHATYKTIKPNLVNKRVLIQMGEFETHLSLITGVMLRDPTKDLRLIEYCMRLPGNQFVFRGTDRRLVKEYLKDYIPEEVLMYKKKGLQSADMIDRLSKNWERIYQECNLLITEDTAKMLLDCPKIKNELDNYKEKLTANEDINKFDVLKLLYSVLMVKYITVNEM